MNSLPGDQVSADLPDQAPIPVEVVRVVALEFGWDQVVIIARRVGGGEHVSTYGVDPANSRAAAIVGNALKRTMGWPEVECQAEPDHIPEHLWARAWRNLFVDERRDIHRRAGVGFEEATALAEDAANRYARAFAEAMRRRSR